MVSKRFLGPVWNAGGLSRSPVLSVGVSATLRRGGSVERMGDNETKGCCVGVSFHLHGL